jgi:HlyD family secretion protein
MKKKIKNGIITVAVIIAALFIIIVMSKERSTNTITDNNFAIAKKGIFEVLVVSTGELQAENYSEILAPEGLASRRLRISGNITITDLVTEGTVVQTGDYVATLDRTELDNTLKTEYDNLTTMETNLEMARLDTAVSLSSLRDNIKNTALNVEEAKITLTQSQYEPPSTIRQAEISLNKIERSLEQLKKSYDLKVQQSLVTIKNYENRLIDQREKIYELENVLSEFVVTAPAPGMIIYMKDRLGVKRKSGSAITTRDRVVATLPDMSTMISKTYVNEIDINNIDTGMDVRILVDAFPGKRYSGKIISISNIGEQLPNASAKVFEVLIRVNESDPTLRPSMTTGNMIIIKEFKDVISAPLMCLLSENDKTFVMIKDKNKTIKQEVTIGDVNENSAIITEGLEEGVSLYYNDIVN